MRAGFALIPKFQGGYMFVISSLLISMFLGVIGQVFIKKGLTSLGSLDFSAALIGSFAKMFLTPFIILGLCLYCLGVFFWLYALSKVDLSFAYPFVSLSYVLVVLFSLFALGESISYIRWIGVFVICLGVFLISRS
jgi:drug/metabolite transporter (DMT)-like permease